jgi:hypothetical protein
MSDTSAKLNVTWTSHGTSKQTKLPVSGLCGNRNKR